MHDEKSVERVLLLICAEAAALRAELCALASELRDEDVLRFERTLTDIEQRSTELLVALPVTVN